MMKNERIRLESCCFGGYHLTIAGYTGLIHVDYKSFEELVKLKDKILNFEILNTGEPI